MFKPMRVIFEEKSLEYERGKQLFEKFKNDNIETRIIKGARVSGIPGKTDAEMYFEGKNTLVVGVRKQLDFQSCKPSAHYMLPLFSGCAGMCEYCYLNTQLGKKPYMKMYVNVEDILAKADEYINSRLPDITIFEGAATSDPIPMEKYSGALADSIRHFAKNDNARFRFVTKFTEVDSLLNIKHNGHTTIRFSLNTDSVITKFEHRVPKMLERIEAAQKVSNSGYNFGFIIAPVIIYDGWQSDYMTLLDTLGERFKDKAPTFEVITHRFTSRAKNQILKTFPSTGLPLNEDERKFKYGQFGYGKFVYKKEDIDEVKEFFRENITKYFDEKSIQYII
jgi:spore photoproduct lyase